MRSAVRNVVIVALLATAFLFGPHLVWLLLPTRAAKIVIVDKTVPFRNYREHDAFVFWLHARKFVHEGGAPYLSARDYVGYDPSAHAGRDLVTADLRGADALFIADTYGVYEGDYASPERVAALERSPKIHGGMSQAEAEAVADYALDDGLVIGEFNTFASPTEEGPRAILEDVFGVHWTHWVGRYWPRLDDANEVPKWIGRLYERVHHAPFDLRGPGYVLVKDDQDILVLTPASGLLDGVVSVERTAEGADLAGLPPRASYLYWVDIVDAIDAEVVYEHRLHVSPEAQRLLGVHGVPAAFPALTRRKAPYRAFYFAGDFVDNAAVQGDPELAGIFAWRALLAKDGEIDGQLLWRWYFPLLDRLVTLRAAAPSLASRLAPRGGGKVAPEAGPPDGGPP